MLAALSAWPSGPETTVSLCYRGEYLVKKCMSHDLPKAYDPTAIEDRWAEYWVKERLFDQPAAGAGAAAQSAFTMLLPPPNVTGRLHMGHMLNQTEMDIIIALAPHARRYDALGSRNGPCRHRHADDGGAAAGDRRQERARGWAAKRFVERVWEWKKHYGGAISGADEAAGRVRRLVPRILHHGRDLSRR